MVAKKEPVSSIGVGLQQQQLGIAGTGLLQHPPWPDGWRRARGQIDGQQGAGGKQSVLQQYVKRADQLVASVRRVQKHQIPGLLLAAQPRQRRATHQRAAGSGTETRLVGAQ